MPANSFILFGTADVPTGESPQAARPGSKGWIEITDWSWDVEAEHSNLKGTGAAVGVATPGTFSFSHTFDKSSPTIMSNIVMGTSFTTATVHMLKSTGADDGKPEVYFGIKMGDCFVCKVSSKGGEDGAISQDVEFVFKSISIGYKQQTNDGKLGNIMPFGWNIATKQTTGVPVTATLDPSSD